MIDINLETKLADNLINVWFTSRVTRVPATEADAKLSVFDRTSIDEFWHDGNKYQLTTKGSQVLKLVRVNL